MSNLASDLVCVEKFTRELNKSLGWTIVYPGHRLGMLCEFPPDILQIFAVDNCLPFTRLGMCCEIPEKFLQYVCGGQLSTQDQMYGMCCEI